MIEQKPKAWHDARRNHIGASEVAVITGVSQYGSPYEIWATKKGIIPPFEGNEATQLGTDLEGSILDVAERDFGAVERDVAVEHESLPLRATLDGWTVDGQGKHCVVECKTAGLLGGNTSAWGDVGDVLFEDQIPAAYYVQVQAQLLVTDAEFAWLYALIARRGICKYKVHAHAPTQEAIGNAVDAWWTKHMVNNVAPKLVGVSKKVLSQLPRRKDSTIELDETAQDVESMLMQAKADKKDAEERVKLYESQLISELGDNEIGTLPDGRRVSFTETVRKAYTRNVAASTYRTLRIEKRKVK